MNIDEAKQYISTNVTKMSEVFKFLVYKETVIDPLDLQNPDYVHIKVAFQIDLPPKMLTYLTSSNIAELFTSLNFLIDFSRSPDKEIRSYIDGSFHRLNAWCNMITKDLEISKRSIPGVV